MTYNWKKLKLSLTSFSYTPFQVISASFCTTATGRELIQYLLGQLVVSLTEFTIILFNICYLEMSICSAIVFLMTTDISILFTLKNFPVEGICNFSSIQTK